MSLQTFQQFGQNVTVVSTFWLDEILLQHTNVQYPNLIFLSYNNNAVVILSVTIEVNGQY